MVIPEPKKEMRLANKWNSKTKKMDEAIAIKQRKRDRLLLVNKWKRDGNSRTMGLLLAKLANK